jgi:molecular chaperone HtpG
MDSFSTTAERQAAQAQDLPAFQDLNLLGIRDRVSQMLVLIGRLGPFEEYTAHDITHVDGMLHMLDWLIPSDVVKIMTPSDWLMIVLSCYFHDAGMLVTRPEFEARDAGGFRQFCEDELFVGDDGTEYHNKIRSLGDRADAFLYQEYVRHYHPERIASWILGQADKIDGVPQASASEVDTALSGLPEQFRKDLALVCASHHLSDLNDLTKYKTSQPYGNSEAETANVHFAALTLRTADLLHITSDRTPSVMLHLVDPRDPVSQREWSKQGAVRRVRPQKGRDRQGKPSATAQRNTIEVFANFQDDRGFFALTTYLRYAQQQLREVRDWARLARESEGVAHTLPWEFIDDREVTAEGFLPRKMSFTLDQERILELLTGHTLYDDVSVVVRELIQNSIDACRLQAVIDGELGKGGKVEIIWNSDERILTIRDNGTGMSQRVIEQNLLRAGASRYQEESFKQIYPTFSPISRFGIGVLSTFMIADDVQITTVSPEDKEALQLTLRSVHGNYLVRLLDKHRDATASELGGHGTKVVLRVRPSVDFPNVLDTVQRWIVVPQCSVSVRIDNHEPVAVGFPTIGDALAQVVEKAGYEVDRTDNEAALPGAVRIVERGTPECRLAMAVRWDSYLREWSFVAGTLPRFQRRERGELRLGTCIEGIRIEDAAPGFTGPQMLAMCNASGSSAPKTNVARSGLEATPERARLLRNVYGGYIGHVANECTALAEQRGMSMTAAGREAKYLSGTLLPRGYEAHYSGSEQKAIALLDRGIFRTVSRSHRVLVTESSGARQLTSGEELMGGAGVWTIDAPLVRAAETLLREIPNQTSLKSLGEAVGADAIMPPAAPLLVDYDVNNYHCRVALDDATVTKIVIQRDRRRVDLYWEWAVDEPVWATVRAEQYGVDFAIALREFDLEGSGSDVGVITHGRLYLFYDVPACNYLRALRDRIAGHRLASTAEAFAGRCVDDFVRFLRRPANSDEYIEERFAESVARLPPGEQAIVADLVCTEELKTAVADTPSRVFNASAWSRQSEPIDDE